MRIKKSHTLIFAILLLAAAVILYVVLPIKSQPEPLIKRLPVQVEPVKGTAAKIIPDPEFEASLRENFPAGTFLRFSGQGQFSLKPGVTGKKGIFFTIAVKSNNKEKIKTTILLKRKGTPIKIQKFQEEYTFHRFAKELSLLKGDEILVEVRGSGTAVVNQPFVYDLVDKQKRKYVFVIALDTLRADRVEAKRNGVELMPALKRFKQDAAVFSNAYAQSSWTLPSFTSFFTGQYEFQHQITRTTSLEEKQPFLIEQIEPEFFTLNFNAGLWMESKFGFSRGFDLFSVMSSPTDSYGGEVLFSRAIDFLKGNNIPAVFMFLHTYQVHSPYAPPREYLQQIDPQAKEEKLDSFFYEKQFNRGIAPPVREAMEELYDAEILAFDHFFDRFIRELKEMGIYHQSLIVFFSDHGEEFYEHQGWAHCHSLYNEVLKIPLLFKFPGNAHKGTEIRANTAVIDILPTITDYYHIKPIDHNPSVTGLSLMPLLAGEKWSRDQLFASTSVTWLVKNIPPKFAIIKDHYKLIYNFPYSRENLDYFSKYGDPPQEESIMVFDMDSDPLEKNPIDYKSNKELMKDLLPSVKTIKEAIQSAMKKKRKPSIRMTPEEEEKLKSLGYL